MIRLSFQGLARFADYGVCRSGIGAITLPKSLEVEVETPQARLPGGGGLATGVLRRISLAAALLLPGSVHGGLISLSTAPLDAAGSNLAANGTLVFAWNVNGDASVAPVINGIAFANAQPASVAIANYPAVVNEGSAATPTTITPDHYSGGMAEVMGDYVGTNFNTNGTVTLSGLSVGAGYRVQFLHHQDVNAGSQRRVRVLFGSGPSATGYVDAGDNTGYVSTLVFTADTSSQTFTLNPGSGARAILNGMVLQQVETSLGVSSPVSRQIFQRDAANTADIPIYGSYSGSFDRIEARAVVMGGAGNNGSSTAWSTIDDTPSGGSFSGTLPDVPAGGWYQLEVRAVSGQAAGQTVAVSRIGVGDVYLTCGQSNAANRGTPAYSPNVDRFSALDYSTNAWSLAADPMPGASVTNASYTGSPWSRLGEMLVNRDQVPVALVCFAESGSDLTRWLPVNEDLYPRIRTAVQRFPRNGFRAILWHQGETNALNANPAATYQGWLATVIAQSRIDSAWAVPWYVAEASRINAGLAKEEPIVAGQRAVIFADPLVFPGAVTDNYHQEGKISDDGVHFNAAGLADHAAQWAEVLGGAPALAPKNGDFENNTALVDGGIATIDNAATTSPCVNGWRALNADNTGAGEGCGYYNPNASFYANAQDSGPSGGVLPGMSGRHVAFLSNSAANTSFLQTRRALLQAGRSYTLTAAIGVRSSAAAFGGATLELLADGKVLASRSIDRAGLDAMNAGNAAGTFTDLALNYTSGQGIAAGQALAIRIRKPGAANTYLDFDNVRLSSVATPFTSWQAGHFGSPSIAAAAWDADPDGDGLANAFEYYLGLDPEVRDSSEFISRPVHDGKAWLRYRIPLDPRVDASALGLWYSFDLSSWLPAADDLAGTVIESRDADEWSLEVSSSDHPDAFFQLRSGPQPP